MEPIIGTPDNDTLVGSDDTLIGADDLIQGLAGDDLI